MRGRTCVFYLRFSSKERLLSRDITIISHTVRLSLSIVAVSLLSALRARTRYSSRCGIPANRTTGIHALIIRVALLAECVEYTMSTTLGDGRKQ